MVMKIKQWFVGAVYSIIGYFAVASGFGIVKQFDNMMNLTGKDFIESFASFILCIVGFVLIPYTAFYLIKDGVKDKWKNPVQTVVEPMEEHNNEEA